MRRLVTACTAAFLAVGCAENTANEEQVALDSVPAAVRTTLDREAAGGTIEEIEREVEGGKTVYEAEVTRDGKTWEVSIAPDGTLLGKEQEDGEDDDKGKDDDGGKKDDD